VEFVWLKLFVWPGFQPSLLVYLSNWSYYPSPPGVYGLDIETLSVLIKLFLCVGFILLPLFKGAVSINLYGYEATFIGFP